LTYVTFTNEATNTTGPDMKWRDAWADMLHRLPNGFQRETQFSRKRKIISEENAVVMVARAGYTHEYNSKT